MNGKKVSVTTIKMLPVVTRCNGMMTYVTADEIQSLLESLYGEDIVVTLLDQDRERYTVSACVVRHDKYYIQTKNKVPCKKSLILYSITWFSD